MLPPLRLLALSSACAHSAGARHSPGAGARINAIHKAALLTPRVKAFEIPANGVPEEKEQWTRVARDNFLENAPATLADTPGFRLLYRYKTADGLAMKGLLYGLVGESGVQTLQSVVVERRSFDLDVAGFERVRQSFRVPQSAR